MAGHLLLPVIHKHQSRKIFDLSTSNTQIERLKKTAPLKYFSLKELEKLIL